MPNVPAAGFDGPHDPDAVIWRYIDFAKLVSLLESQSLHLARADVLDDRFEGSIPLELLIRREQPDSFWRSTTFSPANVPELYRGMRGYVFVNCWCVSQWESAALWPLYVPSHQGVAIRSTYRRLVDALAAEEKPLHVGCVRYIDYTREGFPRRGDAASVENMLTPFIHKRKSFEHERELRIIWFDREAANVNMSNRRLGDELPEEFMEGVRPGGVTARVDLAALIAEVRVSPPAPSWFKDVVDAVVKRYGFNFCTKQSDLGADPVY